MAHFAKVVNNKVTQVIVAEPEFMDTYVGDSPGRWIQTSYNTRGGVHILGGTPLRYNYAGVGFNYDKTADAFYAPQPYPSWILNTNTYLWEAPVAYPSDIDTVPYIWNETNQSWDN